MADLSTLDPTQPPDTQAVAQGAQRIRETRDSTITSFGIEHALTGEHKFPFGDDLARPAAGHAGRLFVNDVSNALEFDNGSAWVSLSSFAGGTGFVLGGAVTTSSTFTDLSTLIYTISLGANVILLAQINISSAGDNIYDSRILIDGTPIVTWPCTDLVAGKARSIGALGLATLSAGVHTMKLQAAGGLVNPHHISSSLMVVVPMG